MYLCDTWKYNLGPWKVLKFLHWYPARTLINDNFKLLCRHVPAKKNISAKKLKVVVYLLNILTSLLINRPFIILLLSALSTIQFLFIPGMSILYKVSVKRGDFSLNLKHCWEVHCWSSQWWRHLLMFLLPWKPINWWHNTNIFENYSSWALCLLILVAKALLEKMVRWGIQMILSPFLG